MQRVTSNPGKTISIYDIPSILKDALPDAITPRNIQAGFRACGISPFNPDVFGEEEFLCSEVTNRPIQTPEYIALETTLPNVEKTNDQDTVNGQNAGPSKESNLDITNNGNAPSTSCAVVSPAQLRPYPKAQPRSQSNRGRKRKSAILTDTPEKEALREEERMRAMKKKTSNVNMAKRKVFVKTKINNNNTTLKARIEMKKVNATVKKAEKV